MKKQTFARKLITLLLFVSLVPLTIFISYRVTLVQNEREAKQDELEDLIWSVYQEHAFHGNELTSYESYIESMYYCDCSCPGTTENDSINVRYYDAESDTIIAGLLFVNYPFRGLFERKIKSPNKYLIVHTSEAGAYTDEFSPVPMYVDLCTKTIVLKGVKGNALYIPVESYQAVHAIVDHIEKYIQSDIPIL